MVVDRGYCRRCGHPEGCVGHNADLSEREKCNNCSICKNPSMYYLMRQMETRSKVTG